MRFSTVGAFDYIELSPDYAVMEMAPPKAWVGRTLSELQVRTRYQVNVIGIKEGSHVRPVVDAGHRFLEGEHILVAGSQEAIRHL